MKAVKAVVFTACICILLSLGVYAYAAENWEYMLENNLLYGTEPAGVSISHGTVGGADATLEVLYDGLYDTIDGYMGTRWAVEENQKSAWINFNLGKLCTMNHIVLITGYPPSSAGGEQWEDFDVYYWNGIDYVLLKSVRNNNEGTLEIAFDEITTNMIRIESRTDNNFRVREVIMLAPGTDYKDSSAVIVNNLSKLEFRYIQPFLKDDRYYVHARAFASEMGYSYEWNDGKNQMTVKKDGEEISLIQDSLTAVKNGESISIEASCFAEGGREYLPVREFCRLTDRICEWNPNTNTVTMKTEEQYYTFSKEEAPYTRYEVEINGEKQRIF